MEHWLLFLFFSSCDPSNWKRKENRNLLYQYFLKLSFLLVFLLVCLGCFAGGIRLIMIPSQRVDHLWQYNVHSDNYAYVYHSEFKAEYEYSLDPHLTNKTKIMETTIPDPLWESQKEDLDRYPYLYYRNTFETFIKNEDWKERKGRIHIFKDGSEIEKGIDFYLFKELSFKVEGPDYKKNCSKFQHAEWDKKEKMCKQKWVVKDICLVIDPEKKVFGKVRKGAKYNGCFRKSECKENPNELCPHPSPTDEDYPIGTYQLIDYNTDIPISIYSKVEVRHFADPWLFLFDLSNGELTFPPTDTGKITLMVLGFWIVIFGFIFGWVECCIFDGLIEHSCKNMKLKKNLKRKATISFAYSGK